jgi:penicillin-binding protein 2
MEKQGVAFGDFIFSGKSTRHNGGFYDEKRKMRGFFLLLCALLAILFVFFRLFYLQVVQGSYYRYLADNNRTKTITVHAPRGIILDRNGTPLVFNVPGFRKIVGDKTTLLTKEDAINLMAKGEKDLEVDSLREYPYKDVLSHVLGYVGQISKEELSDPAFIDHNGGDIIGKMGLEQQYELRLKGTDEKQLVEVDSQGSSIRKLGQTDPIPGLDLKTTIDLSTQKAAFNAMKDTKRGAVVVSSLKGEIIAMVSKPSFDPNLFTMGKGYIATDSSYTNIPDILLDGKTQPLLNRAISGQYPPGSTFKLVVAAAGLEDKIIDQNYQVQDTGVLKVGTFSFANWFYTGYGRTDGLINVIGAIKRSNDIFFYKLAEKVGVDTVSKWASKFGLGKILGIDLQGEEPGVVPTEEWKEKVIGEPWYLGDTYHYGIGQGYLLTTPLQVNGYTQAIANGGILYQPHLLVDPKPKVLSSGLLTDKNLNLLRQGMIEACSQGGVAWPFFDFKVKNPSLKIDGKNILEAPQATTSSDFKDWRKVTVACKTGTAEHGGPTTLPHAWITLFAPAYDPQIVVTVLSEESGEGSNIAAPIAKKVLEEWFSKKLIDK